MKATVVYNKKPSIVEKDRHYIQLNQLNQLEGGVFDEISLGDCMDYVPFDERIKLLGTAAAKLKYGGILNIEAYDLVALSNSLFSGYIKLNEANGVLFNHKLSCSTVEQTMTDIETVGLQLESTFMTELSYNIKAKRSL